MASVMTDSSPQKFSDLKLRIATAILLLVITGGALYAGGFTLVILVTLIATGMWQEWRNLTAGRHYTWMIAGALYIILPCLSILMLAEFSLYHLLYLLGIIIATDIGAYFCGRWIGGPKLSPTISPGKTWSGLLGGMLCAMIVSALLATYLPSPPSLFLSLLYGSLLAVIAQLGDLFESWLKRSAGVKDSGTILPGHGGLLDRMDGVMFTAPLYTILLLLLR